MVAKTSNGVEIKVEVQFQEDYSNIPQENYFYSYKIHIHNYNSFPIKLLRRYWHIFDSNSKIKEVEGEGVVGEQPIIQPNHNYHYVSGCDLNTDIGKMEGTYQMMNLHTQELFTVIIPAFYLICPAKNN